MKKINFYTKGYRKRLYSLLLLLFIPLFLQAQNAPLAKLVEEARKSGKVFKTNQIFEVDNQNARKTDLRDFVEEATLLQIRSISLTNVRKDASETISLIIPNKQIGDLELDLVKQQVVADDFTVFAQNNNSRKAIAYDAGLHYRGIVKGMSTSAVAISVFKDRIMGAIHLEGRQYIIAPVDDSEPSKALQHIFYAVDQMRISNNFECHTDDLVSGSTPNIANISATPDPNNCFRMYFECAYKMYQDKGYSFTSVANYVVGMYNQVALIYQNEGINTTISEIAIWNIPDPYSTMSSSAALTDFRIIRGNSFNGDLAHLLTTGNYGHGGIAYLDVLCNYNNAYSHAYSNIANTYANFPTYSWTVMVVTHEIGHNLGSPHTHACVWNGNNTAIDGCAGFSEGSCSIGAIPTKGTIMSYCHLNVGIDFNLGFGPQPGNLIRSKVYNATCLSPCGQSCYTDLVVNNTFVNGDVFDMEASNTITSAASIQNGADITFDAGQLVRLVPGFRAYRGSRFHGFIDGCGNLKTLTNNDLATSQAKENVLETISGLTNYPNPFEQKTIIEYTLHQETQVSIHIYDLAGRQVAALLNQEVQDIGQHEITFDAQNLANGTYIYRVQVADRIISKKMIVLKN